MTEQQQAFQLLVYGNPVPVKYFHKLKEQEINDTLSPLQLAVQEIKYKGTPAYLLINKGQEIQSVYAQAFKIIRMVLYIHTSMLRTDLIEFLNANVQLYEEQTWDGLLDLFIQRQMISAKQINQTILKIEITDFGKLFYSDNDVSADLKELGIE